MSKEGGFMMLRIMLLGLVASMGFELPSGNDLACWTQSGREWVDARLADQTVPSVEVQKPCALPTDCLQAEKSESCHAPIVVERSNSPEDKTFDAITTRMAADFAADLVAKGDESKSTEVEPSPVVVQEIPPVGLPCGEEVVYQVTLAEKVAVVEVTEVTKVVEVVEVAKVVEVVSDPIVTVEVTEVTDTMQERLDRINSAVRLTREAVQAWAEVIQDPVDETSPTR
jgi:hypothetical protein